MLDNNISFRSVEPSNSSSAQVPAEVYQVILDNVESKNVETYRSKQGQTEQKEYEDVLTFKWKILEDPFKGQALFNNFIPTAFYISPKTGKNKLFKIVEALLGKNLTREDLELFTAQSLNDLVGKQCRVMVENTTKGDKTYSNVVNWLPVKTEIAVKKDVELSDIKF